MSRVITRLIDAAAGLAVAGGVVLAGTGAVQWRNAVAENRRIVAIMTGHARRPDPDAAAPVRAAVAMAMIAHGNLDDARAIADRMSAPALAPLRAGVLYALANARLRQAMGIYMAAPFSKVKPIIILAKAEYRDAIELDPGNWDARYNYALAAALLPDRELYQRSAGAQMSHDRAAWPDIPGAPNGMP